MIEELTEDKQINRARKEILEKAGLPTGLNELKDRGFVFYHLYDEKYLLAEVRGVIQYCTLALTGAASKYKLYNNDNVILRLLIDGAKIEYKGDRRIIDLQYDFERTKWRARIWVGTDSEREITFVPGKLKLL